MHLASNTTTSCCVSRTFFRRRKLYASPSLGRSPLSPPILCSGSPATPIWGVTNRSLVAITQQQHIKVCKQLCRDHNKHRQHTAQHFWPPYLQSRCPLPKSRITCHAPSSCLIVSHPHLHPPSSSSPSSSASSSSIFRIK